MKLTPELLQYVKKAASPEELLSLAKEHGLTLTPEQAAAYFTKPANVSELQDDELNAVAGGCVDMKDSSIMKCDCGYSAYWAGDFSGKTVQCPQCGNYTFRAISFEEEYGS